MGRFSSSLALTLAWSVENWFLGSGSKRRSTLQSFARVWRWLWTVPALTFSGSPSRLRSLLSKEDLWSWRSDTLSPGQFRQALRRARTLFSASAASLLGRRFRSFLGAMAR